MARVVVKGKADIDRLFSELITRPPKTLRDVAKAGKRLAERLAPRKSGKLIEGITLKTVNQNKYRIISKAVNPRTGYPYNLWVNLDIMSWGKSYSQMYKTGTPGFFNETAKALERNYAKEIEFRISQIIRG